MEVLEAAGTKWNFLPFRPGLVGGHCIGVDPYYLTHKAQEIGYHPEVILAGRRINDGMGPTSPPGDPADAAPSGHQPGLPKSRVLVLGLAFKENCPDLRNTRVVDAGGSRLRWKRVRGIQAERVVNLAAQAGVRYSLENPHAYIDSNIVGFTNILEGCRHGGVEHLVYASSSSVYGANRKLPFSVQDTVDHPVSLYAATKKANELMAHTYSHLFGLPTTGLRFFTVYGPWGRPDMALFLFTRKILAGEPIDVFNHGKHTRDFTYVDDIVEGVMRTLDRVPGPIRSSIRCSPTGPQRAVPGLQHRQPPAGGAVRYIEVIEECLGARPQKNLLPLQPGDVPDTCADVEELARDTGYAPATSVEQGVARFVDWYRDYYRV
jgi:UDP-glucuronate 4-epimerase